MSFFFDSHLHSLENYDMNSFDALSKSLVVCAVSSTLEEFNKIQNFSNSKVIIKKAFGIHPWSLISENLSELKILINEKQIDAVGEIGLDFYTDELKATKEKQIDFFLEQVNIAKAKSLPVILHIRNAMKEVFQFVNELKDLNAVIFHAFPGSPQEAKSLIKKIDNVFFSFGTSLLTGRKNSCSCIKELDLNKLLLETDFPYQKINSILPLYDIISKEKNTPLEHVINTISDTALKIFP